MNSKITHIKVTLLMLSALICTELAFAAPSSKDNEPETKTSYFAVVGKEKITWQDYQIAFNEAAKGTLYHGQPSNDALAVIQRSVATNVITNALVLNEANRRKLKPDSEVVNQAVAKFEQKMVNNKQWEESRDHLLPTIKKRYSDENLIKKLEGIVRQMPIPKEAQVHTYYTKHPEKFTSPTEQRISVILLPVDPSSTTEGWEQTIEDGKALIKRIQNGEDFATMAKLYSKDADTVDKGGDMGVLHDGMLPELPQQTVNKLQVGEISEPVRLLEGVAIFRLTDRNQPGLSSFASVKQRATDLLLAEQSDAAWNDFIANLKKKTPIQVDESRFLPLAKTTEAPIENKTETSPTSITK